ncbi:MAG: lasso RiPP family leader peptide-containing protein [Gemmatimonadales bacterium]
MQKLQHPAALAELPLGEWLSTDCFPEESLVTYEKPQVQRFGTFRDLTQGGVINLPGDTGSMFHRS